MMKLIPTSTRGKVRAATFLTAGVVVLGGFAIQGQVRAAQYQHLLNKTYEYAFAELSTSVSQLDTALQKGIYATSPQLFSSLCTEAFRSALAAQTALGSLPYGNVELEGTATFLAKTGDYTMSLSRASAQGLSEEQRATLAALSQRASALCQTLQSLESDLYSGTLRLEDLAQVQERLSQATETGGQTTAGSSFQEIEQECSELPTLIYDGPFSDHLADRTPRMLEGQPQVSREDARSAAAGWLGQEPQLFTPVSDGAGVLPSWGFSAQVDGGELYVEVTKQGGRDSWRSSIPARWVPPSSPGSRPRRGPRPFSSSWAIRIWPRPISSTRAISSPSILRARRGTCSVTPISSRCQWRWITAASWDWKAAITS